MLASVIKIHDLDRTWEMFISNVPNPKGSVAENNLPSGVVPSAMPRFAVQPAAKLVARFDGASVGGRIFIAHGPPFIVGAGLSEHATQLHFPGAPRVSIRFACSPFR